MTDLDPEAIADLGADPEIQALLGRVCELTGMGFAAVAHVSETRWIACQVDDRVAFGLKPGDELEIKKTICDDIRATGRAIAIDNTAADPDWWNHPVPILYGFHILRLAADRHRRQFLRHLVRDRRRPARALAPGQSAGARRNGAGHRRFARAQAARAGLEALRRLDISVTVRYRTVRIGRLRGIDPPRRTPGRTWTAVKTTVAPVVLRTRWTLLAGSMKLSPAR